MRTALSGGLPQKNPRKRDNRAIQWARTMQANIKGNSADIKENDSHIKGNRSKSTQMTHLQKWCAVCLYGKVVCNSTVPVANLCGVSQVYVEISLKDEKSNI